MRKTFWVPITLALAAYVVLPLPGLSAPLSQRIDEKRSQLDQVRQKEGVLTTTIQSYSNRIDSLRGEIDATETRLGRVQRSLDHQKNVLLAVRDRLEQARDRLERLRAELATAREVLAARLVEIYKADTPDALTVVLQADGFGDLLERAEFLDRISDQDREITDEVRVLRDRAEDQATELANLERREQLAAERILRDRDQIAAVKDQLVSSRDQLAAARTERRGALASVQDNRQQLEGDLAALEAEQARVASALQCRAGRLCRPDQAGQRAAGLARQRSGRVGVRHALGQAPRGRGHRGALGHADPRRRFGSCRADGLGGRLRELHLHPAHRQPVHLLRAPVELRHLQRGVGEPGPADRLRGLHRPLLRRPPPF
jgi:peptidoglycan hydrolase CwlO-like protein